MIVNRNRYIECVCALVIVNSVIRCNLNCISNIIIMCVMCVLCIHSQIPCVNSKIYSAMMWQRTVSHAHTRTHIIISSSFRLRTTIWIHIEYLRLQSYSQAFAFFLTCESNIATESVILRRMVMWCFSTMLCACYGTSTCSKYVNQPMMDLHVFAYNAEQIHLNHRLLQPNVKQIIYMCSDVRVTHSFR